VCHRGLGKECTRTGLGFPGSHRTRWNEQGIHRESRNPWDRGGGSVKLLLYCIASLQTTTHRTIAKSAKARAKWQDLISSSHERQAVMICLPDGFIMALHGR
jgi:hypothetical protein